MIEYKKCSKCGNILPIDLFNKRKYKSIIDGHITHVHYGQCKGCKSEYEKLSRKEHLDLLNKYGEDYRILKPYIIKICPNCHKEFQTKSKRQKKCRNNCLPITDLIREHIYLKEHPEINKKDYRKDKKKKYDKEYRKNYYKNNLDLYRRHREAAKDQRLKYTKEQLIEFRAKKREYIKNRMSTDIDYRLKNRLLSSMHQVLSGEKKRIRFIDLLGCSIEDFRKYMEMQFTKDMTWNNWGQFGWHVDHIIPVSSFNFTKEEDQRKCFHYTNLQPLWWKDNILKSNKIIEKQLILL